MPPKRQGPSKDELLKQCIVDVRKLWYLARTAGEEVKAHRFVDAFLEKRREAGLPITKAMRGIMLGAVADLTVVDQAHQFQRDSFGGRLKVLQEGGLLWSLLPESP